MGHGRGRRAGGAAPLRPGRVRYSPGERPARARAAQAADGSPQQHFQYRGAMYRLAACPTCGQAVYLVRAVTGPLRAEDQSQPWDGHGCLHAQDGSAAAETWVALAVQARHQDPLVAGWALVEAVRCDPDGTAGDAAREAIDAVLDVPGGGDGPLLEFLSDAGDPDTATRAALRLGEHLDAAGDLPGAALAYARALDCAAFDPEPAARLTDLVRRAGEHPDTAAALRALRAAASVRDARLRAETALTTAQVYRRAGDSRAAVKVYREALTTALPAYALRAAVGLLDPDLRSGDATADLPEDAPRMVLHAGRVLARLGMPAHAAAMYGLLRGGGDPPHADEAGRAVARLAGWDGTTATPGEAVQVLADLDASRGEHNPRLAQQTVAAAARTLPTGVPVRYAVVAGPDAPAPLARDLADALQRSWPAAVMLDVLQTRPGGRWTSLACTDPGCCTPAGRAAPPDPLLPADLDTAPGEPPPDPLTGPG